MFDGGLNTNDENEMISVSTGAISGHGKNKYTQYTDRQNELKRKIKMPASQFWKLLNLNLIAEPITGLILIGVGIIFGAVIVVISDKHKREMYLAICLFLVIAGLVTIWHYGSRGATEARAEFLKAIYYHPPATGGEIYEPRSVHPVLPD